MYDAEFGRGDLWLEAEYDANRPPSVLHGPFKTDVGDGVLEVAFHNRTDKVA